MTTPPAPSMQALAHEMLRELSAVAAGLIGWDTDKLQARIRGVSLVSSQEDKSLDSYVSLSGDVYTIYLNETLLRYTALAASLWASSISFKDELFPPPIPITFESRAKIAEQLMLAYCRNELASANSLYALLLNEEQGRFAASISHDSIRFTIAHEISHILLELSEKSFKEIESIHGQNHAFSLPFIRLHPKAPEVRTWSDEQILRAWTIELGADWIALDLLNRVAQSESEKNSSFLATQVFLLTFAMFENYYYMKDRHFTRETIPVGTHPLASHRAAHLLSTKIKFFEEPLEISKIAGFVGQQITVIMQSLGIEVLVKPATGKSLYPTEIKGELLDLIAKSSGHLVETLSPTARSLFDSALQKYEEMSAYLRKEYGFGQEINCVMNLDEGRLTLEFADGSAVEADIQAIGSYSTEKASWEWAWNNPNLPEHVRWAVWAAYEYGEKEGLLYLTSGILPTQDELFGTYLSAVAIRLMGGGGVYSRKVGPMTYYLGVRNLRRRSPR